MKFHRIISEQKSKIFTNNLFWFSFINVSEFNKLKIFGFCRNRAGPWFCDCGESGLSSSSKELSCNCEINTESISHFLTKVIKSFDGNDLNKMPTVNLNEVQSFEELWNLLKSDLLKRWEHFLFSSKINFFKLSHVSFINFYFKVDVNKQGCLDQFTGYCNLFLTVEHRSFNSV